MPGDVSDERLAGTRTKPAPYDFFEAARQSYWQAEKAAGGPVERFYTIGRHIIRLCFAGPALVPLLTPALEHLTAEPEPTPSLTILLWDSASTRTSMPPPAWSTDDYVARGEIRGYNDDRLHTSFQMDSGVLNMFDARLDLAIFWARDAQLLPSYQSGAPLLMILHWWARRRGCQLIHAAAVGTSKGGVMLAGKGGSGKSTTAAACLNSGLLYAGDDYCLLEMNDVPHAYSLYSSAKLGAESVRRLPHLEPAIHNTGRSVAEKALIFVHRIYPEAVTRGFPVRAVLLPEVTGRGETVLSPASPMLGLMALAPSTIFQLSGAGRCAFEILAALVKRVPCCHLEIGNDLHRIPEVIRDLLSRQLNDDV
jgi:hypothetical protein